MNEDTLILAAIAIGKQYPFIQKDQGGRVWEPHINDGDALRLAVTLNMCVTSFTKEINVGCVIAGCGRTFCESLNRNPHAAARHAIVRAAAAIGESMFIENHQTEDGCPIDSEQLIIAMFDDGSMDGGRSHGINAGAWHESWNTSRQIHIKAYWIVNDE